MKFRVLYTVGFIIVLSLLAVSFYLQLYQGFVPCPLCTLQRGAFILLGIFFFMGILAYKKRWVRFTIDGLCAFAATLGILLAGQQVRLQYLSPNKTAECGVSLQYMLQALPLNEVLKKVFSGNAECTQVTWEFLHLDMAEWSLIWFIILLMYSLCCALEELRWQPKVTQIPARNI